MKRKHVIITGFSYLLLTAGALFVLFPFLWMLSTAFKQPAEIYSLTMIPAKPTLQHVVYVLEKTLFGKWFINSLIIALISTATVAFFDTLAGYVLAIFTFRAKRLIFVLILSTMMVPTEMLIIPWYLLSNQLGWVDTYTGILFPGLITAFGIFLMKQFMEAIPRELLDAARIDGLGEWGIWLRIALPQVGGAITTLCLLNFLGSWNSYIWPLIVSVSPENLTIPVGLAYFSNENGDRSNWVVSMAGSSISVLPLVVLFLIFQKRIIQGITLTGLR
ncbi:L-arabinose transport system permease protein AraQ [compost metagenome]